MFPVAQLLSELGDEMQEEKAVFVLCFCLLWNSSFSSWQHHLGLFVILCLHCGVFSLKIRPEPESRNKREEVEGELKEGKLIRCRVWVKREVKDFARRAWIQKEQRKWEDVEGEREPGLGWEEEEEEGYLGLSGVGGFLALFSFSPPQIFGSSQTDWNHLPAFFIQAFVLTVDYLQTATWKKYASWKERSAQPCSQDMTAIINKWCF